MDVFDFGPSPNRDLVTRAIARIPPLGRQVHLQGELAAALLPALIAGLIPAPPGYCKLEIPSDRSPPIPGDGEQRHGISVVQGVSLAWVSQVLDERHRPLQRARRAQGKKVSDPWVNIWVTRVDGE